MTLQNSQTYIPRKTSEQHSGFTYQSEQIICLIYRVALVHKISSHI